MAGIFTPCLNETVTYTVPDTLPGTYYYYTLDGDTIDRDAETTIAWTEVGSYELCILANNICSEAQPTCYTIDISDPEPVYERVDLCPGECYELLPDSTVCSGGSYPLLLQDRFGCDSLVVVEITERAASSTALAATICAGDTLRYLGAGYTAADTYTFALVNRFGCDSTVELSLSVVNCPLTGSLQKTDVRCAGTATGSLRFVIDSGVPPYDYRYERLGGGPTGTGTVAADGLETTIDGLPAGTYLLEVVDPFGNEGFFNAEIREPPPLTVAALNSNYRGYGLSCAAAADGRIELQPGGGVGPYTFLWKDGSTSPERADLTEGLYSVTVIDANGCSRSLAVTLTAPPALRVGYSVRDEVCEHPGTGSITGAAATGGVPPYDIELGTGGGALAGTDFSALAAGSYTLSITDGNGCIHTEPVTIRSPERPIFAAAADEPLIRLGERTALRLTGSGWDSVVWQPATGLSCADCPEPVAAPTETTRYVVTATSSDGCAARDTVLLQVVPVRDVYVPNAFSPNQDGVNDRFRPFAGPAVRRVLAFAVYDRWGAKVYEAGDFPPGDSSVGWDGNRADRPAAAGVYTWRARVAFLDGFVKELKGAVVLLPGR